MLSNRHTHTHRHTDQVLYTTLAAHARRGLLCQQSRWILKQEQEVPGRLHSNRQLSQTMTDASWTCTCFHTMAKRFTVRQAHFHILHSFLQAIRRYIDHADRSRQRSFYTMEKKFMVRQAHFHIPCAVFLWAFHRYIDHADQSRRNKMWQKMFVGECQSSRVMGERKREEGREREEGRGREEVTLRLHSSSSTQGWQYLQWLYKRWLV